MPLIFLVAVVPGWLQIVAAHTGGGGEFFNGLLKNQDDFRGQIVSEASIQMFGEARATMIEPPIQAESHLFQTLQCADWLCGLIGRVGCHQVLPDAYADLDWTAKYFIHRLNRAAPNSGIRRERPALGDAAPVEQPPASD